MGIHVPILLMRLVVGLTEEAPIVPFNKDPQKAKKK